MTRERFLLAVAGVGALFFILPGAWALAWPENFYDNVAHFPPYNEHFIHDIGAFQIGIGAALLAAIWRPHDGLFAAFAGAAVGSGVHTLTHFIDHDLGGSDSDVFVFGTMTIVLAVAAALRLGVMPGDEPGR